jgi:uncharacterized membrane protein YkgB
MPSKMANGLHVTPPTLEKKKSKGKVKATAEVIAGLPHSLVMATETLLCFVSDLHTASMLLLLPSADVAPLHIPFTSGKVKVKER